MAQQGLADQMKRKEGNIQAVEAGIWGLEGIQGHCLVMHSVK